MLIGILIFILVIGVLLIRLIMAAGIFLGEERKLLAFNAVGVVMLLAGLCVLILTESGR